MEFVHGTGNKFLQVEEVDSAGYLNIVVGKKGLRVVGKRHLMPTRSVQEHPHVAKQKARRYWKNACAGARRIILSLY